MRLGLLGARRAGVPLIIGSCGGGGNDTAVDGYFEMADRIAKENGFKLKVACIYTQPDRNFLVDKYRRGPDPLPFRAPRTSTRRPSWPTVTSWPCLAPSRFNGRWTPVPTWCSWAAAPMLRFSRPFRWLAASIPGRCGTPPRSSKCGSAAAENRSGQDCLACTLDDDGFILEPLDPELRCTPSQRGRPYAVRDGRPVPSDHALGHVGRERRHLPSRSTSVGCEVVGGTFEPSTQYTAKLEGAAPVGFLSSFWGSIARPDDPVATRHVDRVAEPTSATGSRAPSATRTTST